MTQIGGLPRAAQPFVAFAAVLRSHGFMAAPEQTAAFLAAIDLLGPSGITDIRRAAHATLAPPPERRGHFDTLFDAHFLGTPPPVATIGDTADEDVRVRDSEGGSFEPDAVDEIDTSGEAATSVEALARRRFAPETDNEILRRFERALLERLPRRRGYRRRADRHGRELDLRRSLREAIRNDGELMWLARRRRRTRQRRILLLIDVSGSMKARTEAHFRVAHALARAVEPIEVFTIGTRLTRVTKALRLKNRDLALAAASTLVADWDGGTRIGDALQALLAVPRFAGFARGALVLVLSDGLERGDHRPMASAVARLSLLAWRISWLTPLASDPQYRPETEGLKSILPLIDDLADGSSIERLCMHVLRVPKAGRTAGRSTPGQAAATSAAGNTRLRGEESSHGA